MITFREKWFWALCLAILVHVGVFFVFYINTNNTDSTVIDNNSMQKELPSDVSRLDLPISERVYTTSINSIKDPNETEAEHPQVTQLTSSDKQAATLENDDEAPVKVINSTDDDKLTASAPASKEKPLANKTPVQVDSYPENQADESPPSTVKNTSETLEAFRNNAALLDIDVPTRQTNAKVDKDYLSAKSEVEEINNQLSAAINEVKKRNQQKIDDRQPLRDETSIQNSQNSIERSE